MRVLTATLGATVVIAGVLAAATGATAVPGPVEANAEPTVPGISLIPAQRDITIPQSGGSVIMDPGIWVGISGSAFQFDVGRELYGKPLTITQIISPSQGAPERRPLPASILDGWNGLRNFIKLTVQDSQGNIIKTDNITMCPNSYDPEPVSPDTTGTDPYPLWCLAVDPFKLSDVWGIPAGWAVDPTETVSYSMPLAAGTYSVTETIAPEYVDMFHISPQGVSATVAVTVVNGQENSAQVLNHRAAPASAPDGGTSGFRTASDPATPRTSASLAQVADMSNPPASALPDLRPLPAWLVQTTNISGQDLLQFGATVWVGGNGPLDVGGYRVNGSPVMPAYQYFWKNGHVIGRVGVGTIGFDSQPGHNHWHFEQFAEYQLLSATQTVVVRSQKVGFCIAPTDDIDLALPHASWLPVGVGLSGQCGSPTALSVQEMMPVGWGDTYVQTISGQAFDISSIPNGTYYIEIVANPMHVLRETNMGNDTSLRKVILTGTSGHRHVTVPPWNGIDPEG